MSLKRGKEKNRLEYDIPSIIKFIEDNPNAKIYLGGDSLRIKKDKVKFATVICIHYDGHKGAKIFGKIDYHNISDAKLGRPINRMLKEVELIIEMFKDLEDILTERADDVSIHLDIASDKQHGSNVAYHSAKGMVMSITGIEPMFKNDSFASSFAADHYLHN